MRIFIFSKHVLLRMVERGISRDEILAVVYEKVAVVIYPSTQDELVNIYAGCVHQKYIVVIVNRLTNILITVRQMRKSEKQLFEEFINEKQED